MQPKSFAGKPNLAKVASTVNPYVQAYLTAMGIANDGTVYFTGGYAKTGTAIYTAFGAWFTAIQAAGIDTMAVKWWLPQYGTTLAQKALNFWNPGGANDATYNGGWTLTAGYIQGNGLNNYATANITPNAFFTVNDTTIGFYSNSNSLSSEIDMGARASAGLNDLMLAALYFGTANARMYLYPGLFPANAATVGQFDAVRVSNTDFRMFKNGVQLGATDTSASTDPLPDRPMYLGAFQNGLAPADRSTKQYQGMYAYSGMTPAQVAAHYAANVALNTALGR